jgi:uncharacterized membrane protein (UPF0127 family)
MAWRRISRGYTALVMVLAALAGLSGQAWGEEVSEHGNRWLWVSIGQVSLKAEAVRTPKALNLGLSYRQDLPDGRGMLFFMPRQEKQVFCMRGMKFPLDFIWITGGRVAGLTRQVPADYPGNLESPVPVRYVLEVPAGFVDKYGVKVGDRVSWQ